MNILHQRIFCLGRPISKWSGYQALFHILFKIDLCHLYQYAQTISLLISSSHLPHRLAYVLPAMIAMTMKACLLNYPKHWPAYMACVAFLPHPQRNYPTYFYLKASSSENAQHQVTTRDVLNRDWECVQSDGLISTNPILSVANCRSICQYKDIREYNRVSYDNPRGRRRASI